jgi:hypothetical protein
MWSRRSSWWPALPRRLQHALDLDRWTAGHHLSLASDYSSPEHCRSGRPIDAEGAPGRATPGSEPNAAVYSSITAGTEKKWRRRPNWKRILPGVLGVAYRAPPVPATMTVSSITVLRQPIARLGIHADSLNPPKLRLPAWPLSVVRRAFEV